MSQAEDGSGTQSNEGQKATESLGSENTESESKTEDSSQEATGSEDLNSNTAPAETIDPYQPVTMRAQEVAYAAKLYTLISTPRSTKRFSNIYRMLKSRVDDKHRERFEGPGDTNGEFRVPMLLLAIITGVPREAVKLFPLLYDWTENPVRPNAGEHHRALIRLLQTLIDNPGTSSQKEDLIDLKTRLEPLVKDDAVFDNAKIIGYWLPIVARFSFEVGQVVN